MLVRNRVYHFYPTTSLESWFFRDTLMSLPRLQRLCVPALAQSERNIAHFEMAAR